MARIVGVDIPKDKRAIIALTSIYGIGPSASRDILEKAQVPESARMKDLTEALTFIFSCSPIGTSRS